MNKRIMKMNSFSVLCILLMACSKNNAATDIKPDPPVAADSTYVQYDAPYRNVPAPKDVIMYQVNFRSFSATTDFAGVQERLDSIKDLGVNTLYLMPIYPVGILNAVNSPFCVKDYMSVNAEFGSLAQLRTLVSEAHKRNMAVIFDWIADHTSWDNAWITNKSWYQQNASGAIISPPNTGWNDVAALDFSNTDMRKAMIRAMKYWIYHANIDGYRCDAADFIPMDFWQQAIDSLHAISSHKLILFAEGTRKDHFAAGFQLEYGMGFYYDLVNKVHNANGSVHLVDTINYYEYPNVSVDNQAVRYITNHDVNNSDGTPLDLLGGKNGSIAAFVVAATMKGVPMIYNGQEVGCPVKLNYFNHSTIIDWTINPIMKMTYKNILHFRDSSEALKQGTLTSFDSDDICAFTKTYDGKKVLVIVNLRNTVISYTVPAVLINTAWKNAFDGSNYMVGTQLSLQPYEYRILVP
jgi:glycosidase